MALSYYKTKDTDGTRNSRYSNFIFFLFSSRHLNQLDMLNMLLLHLREDEYVINAYKKEFVQHVLEYITDHHLKDRRGNWSGQIALQGIHSAPKQHVP